MVFRYTYATILNRQHTFDPNCHLGTKVSLQTKILPVGPYAIFFVFAKGFEGAIFAYVLNKNSTQKYMETGATT